MILAAINVYPIKSLGGLNLQDSRVQERGLELDRRWMLVDGNHKFLTQREFPVMATLKVAVEYGGLLVSNGESEVSIDIDQSGNDEATVSIWSSRCRAQVYPARVNEWFSQALKVNCSLVKMPETTRRRVNYFYAAHANDVVSFADGYPFMLIGEESLNDLNSRLEKSIPMDRFRPNFVVRGSAPFAEDTWKKIRIGETVFHLVKPCARCVMTTIDQASGLRAGPDPLRTLASYRIPRRSVKRKILFGQNLIAEEPGSVINVGDKVEIQEFKIKK
jgi:uncharacterized protein